MHNDIMVWLHAHYTLIGYIVVLQWATPPSQVARAVVQSTVHAEIFVGVLSVLVYHKKPCCRKC